MKPFSSFPSSSSTSSSMEKPNRMSKPYSVSPAVSARRALLKRIQRRELQKLQALLPPTLHNHRRSQHVALVAAANRNGRRQRQVDRDNELAIVEDAVRYIDHLHATILARVQCGTLVVAPDFLQLLQNNVNNHDRCNITRSTSSTSRRKTQQLSTKSI